MMKVIRTSLATIALALALALLGLHAAAQGLPTAPGGAATQLPSGGKAAAKPGEETSPENQPTLADDKDVIEASQKWLQLIDRARYGDAWDLGAKPLKKTVSRKGFVDGIAQARKGYGKVAGRKPAQFARTHTLPGAPDGDYALVSFETRFANGRTADEQIVWLLESDVWRVSGYFIR
ncbi:MAG TPA: DUF4019 domain-containing protein [Casimicrobiaceae bacterium]|nr:DUF4019 domain-containing protein [Casimicrobiaceae bacterium]